MAWNATMIGALLGLGTQMYSNALRKLPYMRHPWEHVKWDVTLQRDLDLMLEKAKDANERRYFGVKWVFKFCCVQSKAALPYLRASELDREDVLRRFLLLKTMSLLKFTKAGGAEWKTLSGALRHSLQDRLSKGSSGKSEDEISLKLRTSTAPPLKLIDLPGLDKRGVDESMVSDFAQHNDAILLIIIPAAQALKISSSRALRVAKEYDAEGTRTIGVISKIDLAASDQKALAAVHALLLNQGPQKTVDIPWVALIGQSVSIASAQSSILTGAPQSKLGRMCLVDALAQQIRKRMKIRLPNLLSGLQGKSQVVQDELVRLGESMVDSAEGTRAIALQLCREFEEKFLTHITTGEVLKVPIRKEGIRSEFDSKDLLDN